MRVCHVKFCMFSWILFVRYVDRLLYGVCETLVLLREPLECLPAHTRQRKLVPMNHELFSCLWFVVVHALIIS